MVTKLPPRHNGNPIPSIEQKPTLFMNNHTTVENCHTSQTKWIPKNTVETKYKNKKKYRSMQAAFKPSHHSTVLERVSLVSHCLVIKFNGVCHPA